MQSVFCKKIVLHGVVTLSPTRRSYFDCEGSANVCSLLAHVGCATVVVQPRMQLSLWLRRMHCKGFRKVDGIA